MGKTYRRTDVKNNGYFTQSSTRGQHSNEVSDNIYHSDKYQGNDISSDVKSRQNEIARMEARKIKNRVMAGGEPEYDKTDKTVRSKANKNWAYS